MWGKCSVFNICIYISYIQIYIYKIYMNSEIDGGEREREWEKFSRSYLYTKPKAKVSFSDSWEECHSTRGLLQYFCCILSNGKLMKAQILRNQENRSFNPWWTAWAEQSKITFAEIDEKRIL